MPWITKVLLFLIVLAAVGSTRMSATMTGVRGLAESPSSSTNVAGKHRFRYFTYERMQEHLEQLHKKYPQFTSLTTAQKAYGLPSPGECGRASCEQWILRVTDEATLAPKGARDERPEVFFSGALHGDERIGPTTTLEAVRLMTVLAACVDDSLAASLATHPAWLGADPASAGGLCAGLLDPLDELMVRAGGGKTGGDEVKDVLLRRRRRLLWMYRMVATRSVTIMPAANALGYYQNRRGEGTRDPNRDFPFVQEPSRCFQTVAARALNDLFREHMFQLAITFHGGMQAIAYEWGSPIHPKANHKDVSPDDTSQAQLSSSLSQYGGAGLFSRGRQYPHRPMNSLVYPVHGGMEDWAYAATWDLEEKPGGRATVRPCSVGPGGTHRGGPSGYPKSKSVYTPSMMRIINLLVETSDDKKPGEGTLGSAEAVFLPGASDAEGNGHVGRNVRLVLETTDMVQPYVEWDMDGVTSGTSEGTWFRVPKRYAALPGGWLWSRVVAVPATGDSVAAEAVRLAWRVGGSLQVDRTDVVLGCWPSEELKDYGSVSSAAAGAPLSPSETAAVETWRRIMLAHQLPPSAAHFVSPSSSPLPASSSIMVEASPSSGHTLWSNPGKDEGQLFTSVISPTHLDGASRAASSNSCNGAYFAMARATVDSSWGDIPGGGQPSGTPPQSHFANARTNPRWAHEVNGHGVQGRTSWFSPPVKIIVNTSPPHKERRTTRSIFSNAAMPSTASSSPPLAAAAAAAAAAASPPPPTSSQKMESSGSAVKISGYGVGNLPPSLSSVGTDRRDRFGKSGIGNSERLERHSSLSMTGKLVTSIEPSGSSSSSTHSGFSIMHESRSQPDLWKVLCWVTVVAALVITAIKVLRCSYPSLDALPITLRSVENKYTTRNRRSESEHIWPHRV
jgi:hypothetical protein